MGWLDAYVSTFSIYILTNSIRICMCISAGIKSIEAYACMHIHICTRMQALVPYPEFGVFEAINRIYSDAWGRVPLLRPGASWGVLPEQHWGQTRARPTRSLEVKVLNQDLC